MELMMRIVLGGRDVAGQPLRWAGLFGWAPIPTCWLPHPSSLCWSSTPASPPPTFSHPLAPQDPASRQEAAQRRLATAGAARLARVHDSDSDIEMEERPQKPTLLSKVGGRGVGAVPGWLKGVCG